jgi:hypothetical protein
LADKGTSRSDKGAHGADDGALNTALLDDREQLLREIEETARIEQSMKPAALARADHLLGCPEVLRRAGSKPTVDHLQQVAHDALKAALDTLPIRDRWIGEAILAASGYEGETVDQRKLTLDQAHEINGSTFKKRRKVILERIVDYLLKPEDSIEQSGQRAFDEHQKALKAIEWVALDANALEYACRAYLFANALDDTLATATNGPSPLQPGDEDILLDMLYDCHMDLIASAGYCFDDEPYSNKDIRANLPARVIEHVERKLAIVFEMLPLDFGQERAYICRDYLAPVADLAHTREVKAERRSRWSYFFDLLHLKSEVETHLITVMTECAFIAMFTEEALNINIPVIHESRLPQLSQILASYYGVRSTTVVFNGDDDSMSLHDHLKRYMSRYPAKVIAMGQLTDPDVSRIFDRT